MLDLVCRFISQLLKQTLRKQPLQQQNQLSTALRLGPSTALAAIQAAKNQSMCLQSPLQLKKLSLQRYRYEAALQAHGSKQNALPPSTGAW